MKLALPDVTLCCVDTREPELALQALARCTAQVAFGDVVLFTDLRRLSRAPEGVRTVDVDVPSAAAYSRFILKELLPHVATSHVLIVQWDGFVLDPGAWRDEFLACDYIGAPWAPGQGAQVGNGGFSLRSRKLLQALQDPRIEAAHPEDVCICRTHRHHLEQAHGVRFAPPALAGGFAYERLPPAGPTFGFHGLFNFDRVLAPPALEAFLARLPDAMAASLDAHDLCRQLITDGQLRSASLLLQKRARLRMRDRRTLRLFLRFHLARLRAALTARSAR